MQGTAAVTSRRYRRCLAGDLPGEALGPWEADRLILALHCRGMGAVEIAEWTGWSTYTVARKLARLGLDGETVFQRAG